MRGIPDDQVAILALSVTTVLVALILATVILAASGSLEATTAERLVSILGAAVSAWIGGVVGWLLKGKQDNDTRDRDGTEPPA